MAINGISGKPGGGKSYEAVKHHVIPALMNKRKVVTNLPLQIEHFRSVHGDEIADLIQVVEYNFHEYGTTRPFSKAEEFLVFDDWKNDKGQGVLFVIDECHLSMPAGRGSPETNKLLEYLSMHRHYGHDLILITQNFRKVHRDIRDMINLNYRAIKKSFNGQDDKYILKVHEGVSSTVVNTTEREYESWVFKFYKSHTKSQTNVLEDTTRDVKSWKDSGVYKGSYLMFGLAILSFLFFLSRVTGDDEPEQDTENIEYSEVKQEVQQPPVQPKPVNNQPQQQRQLAPDVKKPKQFNEYEEMIAKSKSYHPYYKVTLAITGFYEDLGTKVVYFSAMQNGQEIFTITNTDLMLAGYDVRILTECSARLQFFDYEDYITCSKPQIQPASTQALALNN